MARIWLITGASRGLGRSLAQAALDHGDVVVATARSLSSIEVSFAKHSADRFLALPLDVTDPQQVQQTLDKAVVRFGRIDIVVNNAGYANIDSIEDVDMIDFRAQFETNFFGVVNVSKAIVPILRKQGTGHIIQISSIGGRVGSPGLASYQSAKWALGGFSTVLQAETAAFGIKVTVCEPGGIKTDWAGSSMKVAELSEGYRESIGGFVGLREKSVSTASDPDHMARAIVHLSTLENPPLRLLLGPDAQQYAKHAAHALAESDEEWASLGALKM